MLSIQHFHFEHALWFLLALLSGQNVNFTHIIYHNLSCPLVSTGALTYSIQLSALCVLYAAQLRQNCTVQHFLKSLTYQIHYSSLSVITYTSMITGLLLHMMRKTEIRRVGIIPKVYEKMSTDLHEKLIEDEADSQCKDWIALFCFIIKMKGKYIYFCTANIACIF